LSTTGPVRSPLEALLLSRRSLRRYAERPVEDEVVRAMVEAARLAPSASNGQPCRYVAVREPAARAALAAACFSGIFTPTRFAARAPLIIALCADRSGLLRAAHALKDSAMYQLDCGIAGEHLVLRAAELGLGTCWIGWFNRRAARRSLGVPRGVKVVSLIAAGYPPEGWAPPPRPRLPLASILWGDRWGRPVPGNELSEDPRGAGVRTGE
jgi:nitroreductase